ncbi:MAG: hypothetical protein A3F72_03580 [Bacteroidetes bacterium RIFCSPLOWO2_12_FULL_35_15]|nr:MAG: hypothetical protein A3F72_03580 [Bacteroidetes bacterium RIFCSPLOWO2_12_FULL_35_15]
MEVLYNIPVSVRFLLEKKKGKIIGECSVYARILLKRDKALISLKLKSVNESDWDFQKERFNDTKKINTSRNNELQKVEEKVRHIYETLKRTGQPLSAKSIKNAYDNKKATHPEMEFMTYYKHYVDEIKLRPDEYGIGVIKHYTKVKNHLDRFLKLYGLQSIKMNELSGKFLERFENFLLTIPNPKTKKCVCYHTCTTYIRKIKSVVNAAYRKEIIPNNPFLSFRLKTIKPANRVSLTNDEVELLRTHPLDGRESLMRVRDAYIFACATGLRYSDAFQLNQSMVNIDNDGIYWISLFQTKTKDYIEIPMTDVAIEIFHRFESHRKETGLVLPMLTNQKTNDHLKTIAKLVGINKKLSFHSSRHSFATNSLEHGVDIASISSLMGHRTIKTTMIYAKTTRKKKVDVIKFLNEKNNPQKKESTPET